jgi:hypothetical protein
MLSRGPILTISHNENFVVLVLRCYAWVFLVMQSTVCLVWVSYWLLAILVRRVMPIHFWEVDSGIFKVCWHLCMRVASCNPVFFMTACLYRHPLLVAVLLKQ